MEMQLRIIKKGRLPLLTHRQSTPCSQHKYRRTSESKMEGQSLIFGERINQQRNRKSQNEQILRKKNLSRQVIARWSVRKRIIKHTLKV